jgi:DNA-binding response OmpR family regulator
MKRMALTEEVAVEVMFVEHDAAVADMYRLKLEIDGYQVTVVNSGDALARATNRAPDLIFLELSPDHPDGLDLLRRLRLATGREHLPAVVLADGGEAGLRSRGLALGPWDYAVPVGPFRSLSDQLPLIA